jgi:hypothetical protein
MQTNTILTSFPSLTLPDGRHCVDLEEIKTAAVNSYSTAVQATQEPKAG